MIWRTLLRRQAVAAVHRSGASAQCVRLFPQGKCKAFLQCECKWMKRRMQSGCTTSARMHMFGTTKLYTLLAVDSAQNMCRCASGYRCIEQGGCTDKLRNARIFSVVAGRTSHHIPYTRCWDHHRVRQSQATTGKRFKTYSRAQIKDKVKGSNDRRLFMSGSLLVPL